MQPDGSLSNALACGAEPEVALVAQDCAGSSHSLLLVGIMFSFRFVSLHLILKIAAPMKYQVCTCSDVLGATDASQCDKYQTHETEPQSGGDDRTESGAPGL
jgi:hypothetical protein